MQAIKPMYHMMLQPSVGRSSGSGALRMSSLVGMSSARLTDKVVDRSSPMRSTAPVLASIVFITSCTSCDVMEVNFLCTKFVKSSASSGRGTHGKQHSNLVDSHHFIHGLGVSCVGQVDVNGTTAHVQDGSHSQNDSFFNFGSIDELAMQT